ncbi:MAG: DUF4169 family protein [Pseudoruegeria sp.]
MANSPINLNRARKQRARLKKTKQASENAAKFGRNKSQVKADLLQNQKQETQLSKHLRDHKGLNAPET